MGAKNLNMHHHDKKISFDTERFDFRALIARYLNCGVLEKIHESDAFDHILSCNTDQNQPLHRLFYSMMDSDPSFSQLYRAFLNEVIKPLFDTTILVQKYPTFRIHQPGNVAVYEWHRDRDYNHNPEEINYYLPVTSAFGTNTFWYESSPDSGNFVPMEASYGEVIEWDGANCRHGNHINDTHQTRISLDFRVLTNESFSRFKPKKSVTQGKSFVVGDCFDYL